MEETEEYKIFADYAAEMNQYNDNSNRINNRILKAIKNQLGEKFKEAILLCAEESDACGPFALVKKPKGEYLDEEYEAFKGLWVDQRSYGDTGDSWQGEVYIKLKENLYLEIGYSM